jgi:hypothetical protein
MDAVLGSIKVGREKSFGSKTACKFSQTTFIKGCVIMRKRRRHLLAGGNPGEK